MVSLCGSRFVAPAARSSCVFHRDALVRAVRADYLHVGVDAPHAHVGGLPARGRVRPVDNLVLAGLVLEPSPIRSYRQDVRCGPRRRCGQVDLLVELLRWPFAIGAYSLLDCRMHLRLSLLATSVRTVASLALLTFEFSSVTSDRAPRCLVRPETCTAFRSAFC